MNERTATLKQLVSESRYPIDERAVAEAIIIRAMARRTIPGLAFRATARPRVRSFRPHRGSSFRLVRAQPSAPRCRLIPAVGIGSPVLR